MSNSPALPHPLASRSLLDRLQSRASEPASPAARAHAAEVVSRWREAVDAGDPGRFERRLRWDRLDEAGVQAALAAPAPPPSAPWEALLEDACAAARDPYEPDDRALDPGDPVAFEEVLLPFVQVARRRLRDAAPALDEALSPRACADLERALLRELSAMAEQALYLDLSVAISLGRRQAIPLGPPAREVYLRFVTRLRDEALQPLLSGYPVLGRLLAVRTGYWVATSAELAGRLRDDAEALARCFGPGAAGPAARVRGAMGDSHCGGRSVAAVRFASGTRVVYKPRPLALDAAFYGLLRWLGEHGLHPAQRTLRLVDSGTHGWVEHVAPGPVDAAQELREYYERAGALVCLAYVIGAADLHSGNLMAVGAHPVPVDLEMMMCAPVPRHGDPGPDGDLLQRETWSTVLGSGLLPQWHTTARGSVLGGGGLGGGPADESATERGWRRVNTDWMSRETRPLSSANPHLPHLDGRAVSPQEHLDDLVRGFRRCHALLQEEREAIAAPGGPLDAFRGTRVRVLLRNTSIYHTAIRRSLHPSYLRDGVQRSLQFEVLHRGILGTDDPVPFWAAFRSEQEDLDLLDYPFFWSHTDGTMLHDGPGRPVGECCLVPPYHQALERLRALDEADRDRQSAIVRFAFASAAAPAATARRGPPAPAAASLDAAGAEREARAIAAALEALAQDDGAGGAQWVGFHRRTDEGRAGMFALGERLYDGRAGIAVFLAAVDAVSATGHTALAGDALRPLRRVLADPRAADALGDRLGIGAGLGTGGLAYAMTLIGRLSGDEAWIREAERAAALITPARIARDRTLDVLGGAAGAALALLSLHEVTGDAGVLARARACGHRLLETAERDPATGAWAWRVEGVRSTGFAHGAAGIGAALLRLAAATGDERFADAGRGAFAFEDALFDAPSRSWADAAAESGAPPPFPQVEAWCHGAVGIGLSRADGGLAVPAAAVAHAVEARPGTCDHLCCGAMGHTELLLAAGARAEAGQLAGQVVARARTAGSYVLNRRVPEARYAPTFFPGISGIGYQVLRVAHADRLPSVLSFR